MKTGNTIIKRLLLSVTLVFFMCCVYPQKPVGDSLAETPLSGCESNVFVFGNPSDYAACVGSTAIFTSCAGQHTTKVWQESIDSGLTWHGIPGTFTSYLFGVVSCDTLVLNGVSVSMSGNMYRCYYTCQTGSTFPAKLTVTPGPGTILIQPVNTSACAGENSEFGIEVSGGSLSYQWQLSTDGGVNFNNIAGATSKKLSLTPVTLSMNNYKYRCIINSPCSPQLMSNAVILSVSTDNTTAITTQPVQQQACGINSSATFSVEVAGQPISYQWQKTSYPYNQFLNISGANSPALTLTGLTNNNDVNYYRCVVTKSCGSNIISNNAPLRVYIDPVISQQPVNANSCVGSTAVFSTRVDSFIRSDALTAQWEQSTDGGLTFSNAAGSASSSTTSVSTTFQFTTSVTSAAMHNYKYRCKLSNPCYTKYSDTASLLLNVQPTIVNHPADVTVCGSANFKRFDVTASGSVTGYQWQVSSDSGITFTNIPGATSSFLLILSINSSLNNNRYRCQVNSACTSPVISNAAVLRVFPVPVIEDTCKSTPCLTCGTDITSVINTAPYPIVIWGIPNPTNAILGNYKLKVTNFSGCSDSAYISVYNITENTARVCKNGKFSITSNISGSTYQWQMAATAGVPFSNINTSGSVNPSGINSPELTLPPITYHYGYRYRCIVDSVNISAVTIVKPTSFWTGEADTNWNNPLNWSCGIIPDADETDIFIYGGKPNYPVINSVVYCRSLTVFPGAAVTVNNGLYKKIIITGQ